MKYNHNTGSGVFQSATPGSTQILTEREDKKPGILLASVIAESIAIGILLIMVVVLVGCRKKKVKHFQG